MVAKTKKLDEKNDYVDAGSLANALESLERKVDDVWTRVGSQSEILREIHEATVKDHGMGWYDLYESDNGYE